MHLSAASCWVNACHLGRSGQICHPGSQLDRGSATSTRQLDQPHGVLQEHTFPGDRTTRRMRNSKQNCYWSLLCCSSGSTSCTNSALGAALRLAPHQGVPLDMYQHTRSQGREARWGVTGCARVRGWVGKGICRTSHHAPADRTKSRTRNRKQNCSWSLVCCSSSPTSCSTVPWVQPFDHPPFKVRPLMGRMTAGHTHDTPEHSHQWHEHSTAQKFKSTARTGSKRGHSSECLAAWDDSAENNYHPFCCSAATRCQIKVRGCACEGGRRGLHTRRMLTQDKNDQKLLL